ncbi:MAG TPA: lipid-A-disaccharide synthase [Acidobacteriaceae bacterium]|jgi:lipid-A-disaccharide synthase|nr:lipid-A-disaccharide synthase [Acidobacteriaceae bacterium]
MSALGPGPKIFLSAGEASGEHYGALLMAEIRRLDPQADFFGLGGKRMAELGLRRVVRAEDVAVMGITEVILHMAHVYREYRKLKASLRAERPDLAILIDFPDVNLNLAAELHRLKIPVVYFVSPQLWAWKKWRIRGVRRNVTRMLVIFPFEEAFYRGRGVAADFVGHPLADLDPPTVTREEFARENGLDTSKTWVGLLPGSRTRELDSNLPPMLEAARLLGPGYEYLLPVAPTLKDSQVQGFTRQAKAAGVRVVHDARAVLQHARASIVASGTATVEAALIGNPFVVVYRVSRITYAVAQRVVRVAHVGMVNLIAGRRIVPELIQHDFTASNVVEQVRPLLENEEARATMQSDLRTVGAALRVNGEGAIQYAARIALQLIPAAEPPGLQSALVSSWPVE